MKRPEWKVFILLYFAFISTAFANEKTSAYIPNAGNNNGACPMLENSQINVNFNMQQIDISKVNDIINNTINNIEELAKKTGLEKFAMQSMNYNLYANANNAYVLSEDGNNMVAYQLNGNISFIALPSDKATELMVALNKKGYRGSLSVNKYRQCRQ